MKIKYVIKILIFLLCSVVTPFLGGCASKVREMPTPATQMLIDRGVAFLTLGAYSPAEASFQMSLESQPTAEGYDGMACVYARTGRYQEARRILSSIAEWFPAYVPAKKHLAFLHDTMGYSAKAAREYQEIIAEEPLDFEARNNLAAVEAELRGNFSNIITNRYIQDARALTAHPVIEENFRKITQGK